MRRIPRYLGDHCSVRVPTDNINHHTTHSALPRDLTSECMDPMYSRDGIPTNGPVRRLPSVDRSPLTIVIQQQMCTPQHTLLQGDAHTFGITQSLEYPGVSFSRQKRKLRERIMLGTCSSFCTSQILSRGGIQIWMTVRKDELFNQVELKM